MSPQEVHAFFDTYGASFRGTPADVARFFHVPCLTARAGVVRLNATPEDVLQTFAEVLQRYRNEGFAEATIASVTSRPAGTNALLATVEWRYRDGADRPLWSWTFTYNLYQGADGWKILVQTLHDD